MSTKFLFDRLLPAAIINAALIFLCVFVLWSPVAIFLLTYGIFAPTNSFNGLFDFWKFLLPILAPLLYRVIWQVLKFERSPGEQWLMLNWPVKQQSKFRVLLNEIAFGAVASLIAFAAVEPSQIFVGRFFGQSSKGLIFIAACTMVPLVYCCTVAFILFLRYRKQSLLLSASETYCLSGCLKNIARLRKTIAIFSLPFFCCIACYVPSYNYQPATWLLLMILVAWWAAGAVIVRYWDSPRAYLFFLFFFVYPSMCYLSMLPAISTMLKVGPLSVIY
ncbi:MAG: hypothetical protein WCT03_22980 [Candidatus Obscuribacterales bacterium]|jgi:hypothetical protein